MTKQIEKKQKTENKEFSIEKLLTQAVEAKVDVGTMEKLLAMRKELREEWAREQFFAALSELQSRLPILKKTKAVTNKDKSIRYKYTPLEEIIKQTKDLIKEMGFSYVIDSEVKENSVKAICKVVHKFGHTETTSFEVPVDKDSFMNAQQKFASALTYAKRYAFCNAFGILTADEDDDTNKTYPVEEMKKTMAQNSITKEDSIIKAKMEFLEKKGIDTSGMSKEDIEKKFLEVRGK